MSKKKKQIPNYNSKPPVAKKVQNGFLLDQMVDGREYQSIVDCKNFTVDLNSELTRAMRDISDIRNHPVICYIANIINPKVSSHAPVDINNDDDLPFVELIKAIPDDEEAVDIILVTPGGSAETVDYIVKLLRGRFKRVSFILPYMAMSAGTILCMSGDELIMDENAFFGPIDPQVRSRDGFLRPAQAIMTLIDTIQERGKKQLDKGEQPNWTDVQILRNLDPKELGNAILASKLSTDLVTNYLGTYKFKDWLQHSDGKPVTDEERKNRANEIATLLCNNSKWLSHSNRITRDIAENVCRLKIIHPEDTEGLDRAIRRFWALVRLTLETSPIAKIYATDNYFLFRSANMMPANKN